MTLVSIVLSELVEATATTMNIRPRGFKEMELLSIFVQTMGVVFVRKRLPQRFAYYFNFLRGSEY